MTAKLTKFDWLAITVAMLFPTLLTFFYFIFLSDSAEWAKRLAFGIGKPLQFAIPILWIAAVRREPWKLRWFSYRSAVEGTLFGVAVFAAMIGLYTVWLGQPGGLLSPDSPATAEILVKVKGMGLTDTGMFMMFGWFYAVIHSGLEEYYWRWFVSGMLRRGMGWLTAAILSSLGFMLHHVLLLGTYFGYDSPFCWLGSLGVAVGGLYWAWLYYRSDSIWGPWISHGIVDAAIFTIGYLICFAPK